MKIPADAVIPPEKLREYLLKLAIVTIWLRWHTDGRVRFVTLKPLKEKRR